MPSVTKHILENGLTVLLKEVHNAPIISWWMLYRIGSRNERTGQTGISHWIEHMLFKGTERFPAGMLDREIDRLGGTWNAQTSTDYTAYYETMPADRIDIALELEADRMMNAVFDPEETESERTVIISERHGLENSPLFWLEEEVIGTAFRVHGYHHDIIGDLADLQTMTREDLYQFYQAFYTPNNAVVAAVGAFDTDEMLAKIQHYYGSLPQGPEPNLFSRAEPPQSGERRVKVERPGTTSFLKVAFHAPPANHPDWFALTLLDSILSGPSSLGGGGIDNKTSRFYKALVETEIAASVNGFVQPTIDPHLYDITLTVRDGRTLEESEAALLSEIDRAIEGDITEAELKKAKKQARALFAYGTEGVTEQAFWLAFAEIFDSYTWFEEFPNHIESVTLEDVQRVANTYLRPQNRIVGWLVPTGEDSHGD